MEIVFSVITQTDLYGFFFPAQMGNTLVRAEGEVIFSNVED